MPVVVGLLFRFVVSDLHYGGGTRTRGWLAVSGLLIVGTIGGIIMATFLNNGGGAWDNAKKYIEAGSLKDDDGQRARQRDGDARRPRSSATRSATRSRTPRARRCTCWSSC